MRKIKVIILAAGKGKYIKDKLIAGPLITVGKKTIIEHQYGVLKECCILDITMVINGDPSLWSKTNIDFVKKYVNTLIINGNHKSKGVGYSLKLGVNHLKDLTKKIIVIDGDLWFNEQTIKSILDFDEKKSAILIQKRTSQDETGVFYETKMKEGYILKKINKDVLSDYVYSGISAFSTKDSEYLKKVLVTSRYDEQDFPYLLNSFAEKKNFYCIKTFMDEKRREYIDIKDMAGGSFAKTYKLRSNREYIIRKQLINPGEEKLKNECEWLLNLPSAAKKHFPEVLDSHFNPQLPYIDLKYYDMDTIRTKIIKDGMDSDEVISSMNNVLHFLFNTLYNSNKKKCPKDFIFNTHIKRTYMRLNDVSSRVKFFAEVINEDYIYINNKKYHNILFLLDKMNKDKKFIKKVSPKLLNSIHGDLHFDNILYNSKKEFILVDPKGLTHGDIAYDIGKLFHSCHGFYDLIHTKRFILKRKNMNHFSFNVCGGKLKETYHQIFLKLQEVLMGFPESEKGKDLIIRSLFSEAMHFCSVLPFHLAYDGKEEIGLALYLVGTMLLNNIYPFDGRLLYNINNLEDYLNLIDAIK